MADIYREMEDGTQVPFRPSARPEIVAWMREHILDRHLDTPESRHRWPRKTKFPRGWDADRVLAAVDLALAEPDGVPERFGDTIRFQRLVEGELVRVHVRTDRVPPEIWSAYPVDEGG